MDSHAPSYHRFRFPPPIISHAVWLYHRFCLSFRDAEDLLAQRGITVSYETIRQWCLTFGPEYARTLRRRGSRLGDTWYLDELFVTIQGRRQYLWRAVDHDGDVIDILVQSRRDGRAAKRFFRKLLKGQGCVPRRLIRQATQLFGRPPRGDAVGGAQHPTVRKQSCRSLSPADPPSRGSDTPVQIGRPSAAIPVRARHRPQPVSCRPSLIESGPPPHVVVDFITRHSYSHS